jgi:hypothetical protein
MALAIKKTSDAEVPLIGELGNFVRGKSIACYDRALEFLSVVDGQMDKTRALYYSNPDALWLAISRLIVRPFLCGTSIRALASPSFPLHGSFYLFQHQLHAEMERYNAVMATVMRSATSDIIDVDFHCKEYRLWLEADHAMRRAFVDLAVRGEFTELCRVIRPNWGDQERKEWNEWIKKRMSAGLA